MNEAVLGLLGALAIYGLAALALPQAGRPGGATDLAAEIEADTPEPAPAEDETSGIG